MSPRGDVTDKQVVCVDGATGRVIARVPGFKRASLALFAYQPPLGMEAVAQTQPSPETQPVQAP